MSLYVLFLFLTVILLIIEMSTLLFQSTGLKREVARFQSISLLTGTGFTTTEAELITKHPMRRRIAEILILFGNISFALIIAIFLNFLNQEFVFSEVIIGFLVMSALFFLFRIRKVQNIMVKRMKTNLSHIITLDEVFHLSEQDVVVEVSLKEIHRHLFVSLRELDMATKHGIHILTILRHHEEGKKDVAEFIKYPTGTTKLQLGDKLTLFGNKEAIHNLFGGPFL